MTKLLLRLFVKGHKTPERPEVRSRVEQGLAELVREQFPQAEVLMGTATAGIAHAAIVGHIMGLPMGYVRSGSKDHGRQNQIEGRLEKGQKVVVIEDLISTGGSCIEVVNALREAGAEVLDLANSIYIDWGSFINAINNFVRRAFVLVCIVRVFNRVRDNQKEAAEAAQSRKAKKADRKVMKAEGVNVRDKAAVAAWYAARTEKAAAEAAAAAAAAEEQARLDRLANPTTEDLLKAILAEMKKD